MILHTASEVVSHARKMENESAEFYKALAGRYDRNEAVFLSYAEENGRNIKQVERAYYGSISDALEGGFAFNLEADKYTFEATLAPDADYPEALKKIIEIEELITGFYSVAGQSQSLMADVQRAFRLLVRKRGDRIEKFEILLKSAETDSE